MINRRFFVAGLAAAIGCQTCLPAAAGDAPKRVVYVSASSFNTDTRKILEEALAASGWVVGHSIVIEYRSADGQYSRLPGLVNEALRLKPDVLLAGQTPAAQALKKATGEIPIVMVGLGDPVRYGIVASLTRPEGNITGTTWRVNEVGIKVLELLKEAAPKAVNIAFLVNLDNIGGAPLVEAAREAAPRLGVNIHVVEANTPDTLDQAFATISRERADAIWIGPEAFLLANRNRIVEFSLARRIPAVGPSPAFPRAGALLSYSPHLPSLLKDTAGYVDRLLRGAKTWQLPVQDPSRFELVLNARTAKALNITFPQSLLLRADEVIQ